MILNDDIKDDVYLEELRVKYMEYFAYYDIPRLEKEVLPDGVKILDCGKYECLRPVNEDPALKDKCFILIHGGAFVYGYRKLDRCYGMHLAKQSGMSVINIDYTYMPDVNLTELIDRLLVTIEEATRLFGFTTINLTGDSSGSYLAYAIALSMKNRLIAQGFGLEELPDLNIGSLALVCGCYTLPKDKFPGIYFEKKKPSPVLADFAYDLSKAAVMEPGLKVALITGDKDFIREDNRDMYAKLKKAGSDVTLLDQESDEEHQLYHDYVISDPTSPQSQKAIRLFCKNAK
ncbi:MAG: alpha/beta hydrolase [Saccharofermentans sp.]|nr:alpha/beta hydrolase [Saccharofermentans sp.]